MAYAVRQLGRKKAHREHMLRNLAVSLILFEKVDTTEAKAKEVRRIVDRWIATAKYGTVAARRTVMKQVFDNKAVDKLFEVLGARYANRPSGFSRMMRLGARLGDGAPIIRMELISETEAVKTKEVAEAKIDTEPVKKAVKKASATASSIKKSSK